MKSINFFSIGRYVVNYILTTIIIVLIASCFGSLYNLFIKPRIGFALNKLLSVDYIINIFILIFILILPQWLTLSSTDKSN